MSSELACDECGTEVPIDDVEIVDRRQLCVDCAYDDLQRKAGRAPGAERRPARRSPRSR